MSEARPVAAEPFDPSDAAAAGRYAESLRPQSGATHLLIVWDGEDWSVRALIALADAIAALAEEAVVLADLAFEQPPLAQRLGVEVEEGLTDVLLYGASADRVRVTATGHRFDVIPTGFVAMEPAELLRHPQLQNLIDAIETQGARLLAVVPVDSTAISGLLRRTSVVFLGSDGAARRWRARWPAAEVLLTLRPVTPVKPPAVTVARGDEPSQTESTPLRKRSTAGEPVAASVAVTARSRAAASAAATPGVEATAQPWRRAAAITLVLVLIVAAVAAVWRFGGRSFGDGDGAPAQSATEPPAPAETVAALSPLSAVQPAGALLPYSVAVEAHDNLPMASRRVATLRAAMPAIGFFTAPILVDSTLYYRVMAGPLPDTAAAAQAVQALLAGGYKTGATEWDIRSTPYAFLIGEYGQSEQATARMQELEALDIPSYVVEVPYTDGPPKYYLYSGAYAGPAEADLMRGLLRSAGLPDTFVQRIGRSPGSPSNGRRR